MPPGYSDIIASLRQSRLAFHFALSDTRARYRRSVLGPFWLALGTAVGVVGMGLLWSELLKVDRATFIPSLTAGLIVWQMLAACITEGTAVFTRQANVIRNLQLPYFLHPMQLVLRNLVNLAHNLLVFVVVAIVLAVPASWSTLLVIPGLVLTVLNLLWMALMLGMLGARFRDVEYALGAVMPLLFVISPVLFRPDYLPFGSTIIWMNPLSHLIDVIRSPLLGVSPPLFVYYTVGGMLLVGWALTLALFNSRRNRIAFWV